MGAAHTMTVSGKKLTSIAVMGFNLLRFDPVALGVSALMPAAILTATALSKLRRPRTFRQVVANYGLLPAPLVAPIAYALPYVELAVALGLLLPQARQLAAFAALGLLGAFTLALAANLYRGRRHFDCGCHFGKTGTLLSGPLLLRNGLLMLSVIPGALSEAPLREAVWIDELTVLCASAIGFLGYTMMGELLAPRFAASVPTSPTVRR